jgi:hypothetical protein
MQQSEQPCSLCSSSVPTGMIEETITADRPAGGPSLTLEGIR